MKHVKQLKEGNIDNTAEPNCRFILALPVQDYILI